MKHLFSKKAAVLLVVLFTSIGMYAANYDFEAGGLYYKITDTANRYVTLVKGEQNYEGAIEIPATVDYNDKTYKVKALNTNTFQECEFLTSVTINSNYISVVPSYCFYRSSIKTVTLGEGVEIIDQDAFSGCTKLSKINLGDITSIGSSAFSGCSSLQRVTFDQLEEIRASAFSGCTKLSEINLGENITSIGSSAFYGCIQLLSIDIPNSVQNIGSYAFSECSNLAHATIGNGVKTIPDYCFYRCTDLNTVTLDSKVETIGQHAFEGCTTLENINLDGSIITISSQAFYGCSKLTVVTLGDKVKTIEGSAFAGSALQSIDIPNSVQTIGMSAFANCSSLTTANVGNGVQTLPTNCFSECTRLQSLELGTGIQTIADYSMYGCSSLTSVTCHMNPPCTLNNSNSHAFQGISSNCILYVPRGTKDAYIAAGWTTDIFKGGIVEMDPRAEQTLSLTALEAKIYGDAAVTLPAKTNEGLTLTWSSENTGVATISGNTLTVKGAGETVITASQVGNDDYKEFSKEFTLTVSKAPLTITAKSYTIKQGDQMPTFEVTYSGFKNGETASALTTQPTISCTATSSGTKGTFPITVSGATSQNYTITFVEGQLVIGEADAVTVTANSYTREYGEGNPTFGYTSTGTLTGTPALSCTATSASPAGTYDIEVAQGSVTTYNVSYVKGKLTITKAPLTITAQSYTIKQGDPLPTFTANFEGFKNGESETILTTQPTFSCSATSASAPGSYDIVVKSATAANYDITMVKGTLTIVEADPVTVTAKSYTREYGEANPTFEYTSTGATLNGAPTLSCTATATSPVGSYDILVTKGTVTNYNDSYVNGTLSVTKAPLTITAKNYTITQGEQLPTFEVIYSGFKNGETASVFTQQPTFSCEATTSNTPGEYNIIVSGADAQNYNIKYKAGTLTINPAEAVTVTAKSYTREYGETNPVFAYNTTGGTLNGTPTLTCEATAASPAGIYTITASRGSVSNPNANFVNGKLTITKAPLTITARDYTITQGQALPEYAASYEGFKNGENEDVLTQQPNFICAATKASAPGTYPITVKDATAQNYDITFVAGTLTIEEEPDDPILVDGNCIDGIYYNFLNSNLTATVINGDNPYTGSVTIPRAVKYMGSTYTVTSIGMEAFKNCTGLTSVSIPSSVNTISAQAFYGCTGLTAVTIPDGVTSIGNEAFYNCNNLATVVIGDDVKTIGDNAFTACYALTELTLGKRVTTIGQFAFYYCRNLTSVAIPRSVTYFGYEAFRYCDRLTAVHITDLAAWCGVYAVDGTGSNPLDVARHLYLNGAEVKELVIPDGVKTINNLAFKNCDGLRTLTIPKSVTTINLKSFYLCDNLVTVNIEGQGTAIGESAFQSCSNMLTLNVTGSITSSGNNAFSGCSKLNKVNITDLAAWCKIAFSGGGNPLWYAHHLYVNDEEVKDLVIPNGVTSIPDRAFEGCSYLTSVSIPNGVTSIGSDAFSGCKNLTSVSLPNSVTSIGYEAFLDCTGLTSVTLSSGLAAIPNYAFKGCTGLLSVTIPEGVTSIGDYAFQNCTAMTSVDIPSTVTSIGKDAFNGCTALASMGISDLAAWTKVSFGNEKSTPLYYAPTLKLNGEEVTDLVFPEGISSIGNYAFQYWKNLTSVVIGNSVTSIGEGAFQYCPNLKNVTIGSSVTTVGQYAFRSCTDMQNLVVGNSVNSIGDQAFYNCGDLRSIVVVKGNSKYDSRENCNALIETATNKLLLGCRNTVIPEGIKTIAHYAFLNCNGLDYLNIPSSVTSFSGAQSHYSATYPSVFNGSDLRQVDIHCSIYYSDQFLFRELNSLETIVLGSEVAYLTSGTIDRCQNVQTVVSYIQEPFALATNAFNFYNTYNTCKLIVPAGTRDAYIAKGWTESIFKGGVVEADANTMEMADQKVNQGKSITIPIEMNNVDNITAFQFEVVLPEGITWSSCKLAGREEDHVLSAKKQASGIYVVTALSMGDENFSGNSGAVATLTLNVDEKQVPGLYRLNVRNIELTTEDGEAVHPLDASATLTIKDFTLGDTNGDGDITITDAVVIVSHILGNDTADFVSNAADVNEDGDITITDAVAIVRMVLNGETSYANVREFVIEDIENFDEIDW